MPLKAKQLESGLASHFLSPRGGGLDDGPNIATALAAAAGRKRLILQGDYTIATSTYTAGLLAGIPSHTRLWCAPLTTFTSIMSSVDYRHSVPFLALWTYGPGTYDTTLHVAGVLGVALLNLTAAVPSGSWILVGDATLSACAIYKTTGVGVSAAGGFATPLDRAVSTNLANGVQVLVLADIAQDIDLDFNGALLSGTGLEAIAFLGARDSYIRGLRVDASAGVFTNYNGVQFNDGCFNCHVIDHVADGLGIAGNGPHIANSESCTSVRMRVARFTGLGASYIDTIGCAGEDVVIEGCIGTGLSVGSIRAGLSDTRNNHFTRVKTTRCGDGIGIDNNARGTILTDVAGDYCTGYGLHVLSASGTLIDGLLTRGNASYGARIESDTIIRKWNADDNASGALLNVGAAKTLVDGFRWGMDSTTLPVFGAANVGTGTVTIKHGRSTVGASSGDATAYNASTGTIIREDVVTFGRGGYYAEATASKLEDRAGVDDSACTVANVFGAGATTNKGTFTLNGVTQVDVAGAFPIGATISWSLATVGGTPGIVAPYFSAAQIAGHFYVKSGTALANDTYNWRATW